MAKYGFLLALWVCVSISCSKSQEVGNEAPKPADTVSGGALAVRVMSFNVRHCTPVVPVGNTQPDIAATTAAIQSGVPDIVLLQELDEKTGRSNGVDQLRALSVSTGLQYYHFGKTINYDGGAYGIGLLSRYPLAEVRMVLLPHQEIPGERVEQRGVLLASVKLPNGRSIRVANTHLGLHEENRELQVAEIIKLTQESTGSLIIGGDFNVTPDDPVMAQFQAAGLLPTCTTCLSIPSMMPNRQIDFILTQRDVKVKERVVISGTTASDHLPIVAVLEVDE